MKNYTGKGSTVQIQVADDVSTVRQVDNLFGNPKKKKKMKLKQINLIQKEKRE